MGECTCGCVASCLALLCYTILHMLVFVTLKNSSYERVALAHIVGPGTCFNTHVMYRHKATFPRIYSFRTFIVTLLVIIERVYYRLKIKALLIINYLLA